MNRKARVFAAAAFAAFTLPIQAVTVDSVDKLIAAVENKERWIDIWPTTYDLSDREPMTAPDGTKAYLVISHYCSFKDGWMTCHWSERSNGVVIKGGDKARLIYCYGDGRGIVFQNITFEGGDAGTGNGGAIMFNAKGAGYATNCVFRSSKADRGGALYSVSALDCCFTNCSATTAGGGVYCPNAADRYVNCHFVGNSADVGGGFGCNAYSKSVSQCVFTNCTATTGGGGMYSSVAVDELSDVVFCGNSTGDKGGHLHVSALTKATNCTFKDGVSDTTYGGVYLNTYGGMFSNCVFDNNTNKVASTVGSHVNNARTVSDCVFRGWGDVRAQLYERCTFDKCRYFAGEASYSDGMLTFVSYREAGSIKNCLFAGCETSILINNESNKELPIWNCTFADNKLRYWGNHAGATFQAHRADENRPSTNVIVNCIFAGNKIATQASIASDTYFDSDFVSKATKYKVESCPCLNLVSNAVCLAYDPTYNGDNPPALNGFKCVADVKFNRDADPALPYYSLQGTSRAVDRGLDVGWTASDKDLAGNARVVGTAVDLGCYECANPEHPGMVIIFR